MKIIYEVYTSPLSGVESVKATLENGHTLFIPKDPANSDYQRYLRWLEDPNAEENQGGLN